MPRQRHGGQSAFMPTLQLRSPKLSNIAEPQVTPSFGFLLAVGAIAWSTVVFVRAHIHRYLPAAQQEGGSAGSVADREGASPTPMWLRLFSLVTPILRDGIALTLLWGAILTLVR